MSENQPQYPPVAVCVLGMHRSGTSALARLINLLGVDLGKDLIPGSRDNPKGFWEHRGILNAHEDLLDAMDSSFDDFFPLPAGWNHQEKVEPFRKRLIEIVYGQYSQSRMWGFKDPRTCRLLPIWHEVLDSVGVSGRFVILIRSPEEIARSLTARDGYAFNKSLLLTLTHLMDAETGTRDRPRVVVSFDRLLEDWKSETARIEKALGIKWPRKVREIESEVAEFLDPKLRHHAVDSPISKSDAARWADANAVRWMSQLHEMFLGAVDDPGKIDSAMVDRLRREFDGDRPRLGDWRSHRSLERGYMMLEQWGTNLDRKWKEACDENNWLKLALAQVGVDPAGAVEAMKGQGEIQKSPADNASAQLLAERSAAAARIMQLQATIDRLMFEAEGLRGRNALHQERLQWLDVHVPRLEAEIAHLKAGLARAIGERDAEIEKLRKWVGELEAARDWLVQERDKARAEVESLRKWAAELEKAKAWLADQRSQLMAEMKIEQQLVAVKRKAE